MLDYRNAPGRSAQVPQIPTGVQAGFHEQNSRGEDHVGSDGLRQAVRVQILPQILLHAGEGEDDATAGQFEAQGVDGGQGPAVEVVRVGEEEWGVVAVDQQPGDRTASG